MSVELENPGESSPALSPDSSGESAAASTESQRGAKRFDFRHPVFLSSAEWRKIRVEVEEFTESLGALLSTYLRLEFGLQLAKLDTTTFTEFTAALPASTHLAMFKLEPLRGISVMEVGPGIGLGIVDRLLGGPGKPATMERGLTEMEVALMDQVVQLVLGEWCKQWKRFQDLRPEIIGHESNPRFLQCSSGDAILLAVTLEARMGDCTGQIQIVVPYTAFEPLLGKVTENASAPPAPPAQSAALKWNRSLEAVPISVKARWPSFKVSTRELLKLKVGEILPLHSQAAERVELQVGKVAKFRGRLGTRDQKWAVQITEVFKL